MLHQSVCNEKRRFKRVLVCLFKNEVKRILRLATLKLFQFNALCTSILNKSCGLRVVSRSLVLNTLHQFVPGAMKHLIDFKGDLFLHFEASKKSNA